MNFRVNTITAYTARCNRLNVSFVDVADIPADFTFTLFAPSTVAVEEGKICNLPKFVCDSIWGRNYSYIFKDLIKAAKKTVHHRNEKLEAAKKAVEALDAAKALNVEEEKPVTGEYFGMQGQRAIVTLKNFKARYSKEGTYSGIWSHTGSYWTSVCSCLLYAFDTEY